MKCCLKPWALSPETRRKSGPLQEQVSSPLLCYISAVSFSLACEDQGLSHLSLFPDRLSYWLFKSPGASWCCLYMSHTARVCLGVPPLLGRCSLCLQPPVPSSHLTCFFVTAFLPGEVWWLTHGIFQVLAVTVLEM